MSRIPVTRGTVVTPGDWRASEHLLAAVTATVATAATAGRRVYIMTSHQPAAVRAGGAVRPS